MYILYMVKQQHEFMKVEHVYTSQFVGMSGG
jgi:hypothetical protein